MRKNGKLKLKTLFAALGSAAAVMLSFAPLDAVAQIAASKHNLGSTQAGTSSKFDGTDEICVFCHTPHGANTAVSAPLWNKTVPSTTYQMYSTGGSYSIDGTEATVGSVSLACLSCHDGSLAVATMINKPGSGGYNAAGSVLAGAWTNSDATGGIDPLTGMMRSGAIQNISMGSGAGDLRNDHPISIQYCGGGLSGNGTTVVQGTCVDADFKMPATKLVNANQVFWVDTGAANGTREKTDLSLYTRASGVTGPMVECASCHDPHTTANPTFLRVSNTGSGLCLSCHTK